MDDLIEKIKAATRFVADVFRASWTVLQIAYVPPSSMKHRRDQMAVNYKAAIVSIILLFIARALQGHRVNDPTGSALVVGILVGLVVALKFLCDFIVQIAKHLGADVSANNREAATNWFSLLIAIWTCGLAISILIGIAEHFGFIDLNMFFYNSFVLPFIAAVLGLLIVVAKTKYIVRAPLGDWKVVALFTTVSVGFVSIALWLTVFLHFGA